MSAEWHSMTASQDVWGILQSLSVTSSPLRLHHYPGVCTNTSGMPTLHTRPFPSTNTRPGKPLLFCARRLSSPSPIQSTWLTQGPGLTCPAAAKAEERHGVVEEQREPCLVSHDTSTHSRSRGRGVWTDATHAGAETTYTLRHFEGNKADTAVRNTFLSAGLKLTCVHAHPCCTHTVPMSALNKCS